MFKDKKRVSNYSESIVNIKQTQINNFEPVLKHENIFFYPIIYVNTDHKQ